MINIIFSFWDESYVLPLPTNIISGTMWLLAGIILIALPVHWRENHPRVPLHKTPWSVWFPPFLCLFAGLYQVGYGITEML